MAGAGLSHVLTRTYRLAASSQCTKCVRALAHMYVDITNCSSGHVHIAHGSVLYAPTHVCARRQRRALLPASTTCTPALWHPGRLDGSPPERHVPRQHLLLRTCRSAPAAPHLLLSASPCRVLPAHSSACDAKLDCYLSSALSPLAIAWQSSSANGTAAQTPWLLL